MTRRRAMRLILPALLFLSACDSRGGDAFRVREPAASPSSETGPVIGLVGTMSGPDATRGTDAFEGADLAVQALNQELTSGELPFQLVTLDDEGDPELATRLVEQLAASDRTVGVVYAGPLEGLPPADAALARAGIPAILCFGDLFSPSLLRSHLFQVSPPLDWQAQRLGSYLRRDRRYRKVGLIAERGISGDAALTSMRRALAAVGGRLLSVRYEPGAPIPPDVLGPFRKEAEAIVVQGRPAALVEVVSHLEAEGAIYKTTAAARIPTKSRNKKVARRVARRPWRPQIAAFDGAFAPLPAADANQIPPGTVVAESYARGAYYLPTDSLSDFRSRFRDWWDADPVGWQRRSYEATGALGWAARRAAPGEDVAQVLEQMEDQRFGGTNLSFDADDHVGPEPEVIGLWVKPRPGIAVRERGDIPPGLPWVPLARGFSTDGVSSDVEPEDWANLFTGPFTSGRGPSVTRARYGVTSGRRDPVH